MTKAIAECHYHTLTMQKRIEALVLEEMLTYEELSGLIGGPVRSYMHLSRSVRHRAMQSSGVVTQVVPKVGIKRLADTGILGLGDARRQHIRRTSRRALRELGHVEFSNLDDAGKRSHNLVVS